MPPEPRSTDAWRIDRITHTGGLHALAAEWERLWAQSPTATPFQSPHWLIPWWHQFGRGGLSTLAIRDAAGELVGIAPLYVHSSKGLRTMRFLGAGTSDYLDILARPSREEDVVTATIADLATQADRWDAVELQQLPASSPLLKVSRIGVEWGDTLPADPCPILPLGSENHAGSGRLRANLVADRRRLERDFGRVAIEEANAETFATAFECLERLHAARWSARGELGVLGAEEVVAFHRSAARGLLDRGVLRLYLLVAGEVVAGAYYGFLHAGRAYYYLGGFDPRFRPYGIGNQLVAHAIAQARREGASVFDFLRGQESYKYRWGASDTPTFCRRFVRDRSTDDEDRPFFQTETREEADRSSARSAA